MNQFTPEWDPNPNRVPPPEPNPTDYRITTPGPYTSPRPPAPPKRDKAATGAWIALGCLGGLAILGLAVSAGNDHTAVDIPNSPVAPAVKPKGSAKATVVPIKPKPVEQAPKTIPGDGTWIVGVDVEPGRYRSVVPADTFLCMWQRLGKNGRVIALGVGDPGESMVFTVQASDSEIRVDDCGSWKRVS